MIQWSCKSFCDLKLEELYSLLALRQEVFVVEQYCPYLDVDGKDTNCYHLLGKDKDDNLLAYARLIPEGVSYLDAVSIGRIISSKTARGTGLGKALIVESMKALEELFGKKDIQIGAQCYLMGFYAKFGFEPISDVYLEDGIPHVEMRRVYFKK